MTSPIPEISASTGPRPLAATDTNFLDGLRGLAAFYVVLSHGRYLLTADNQERARHAVVPLIDKIPQWGLLPFRFGHQAVLFFFVLSGFVIHLNNARRLQADGAAFRFGVQKYFWRRIRRLYPPLLLAIALTFAMDRWGMSLGFGIYSGHTSCKLINDTIFPHHEPATLLGNLSFLMYSVVPMWGTDGPLWSLHFEWWFYCLYPLLLVMNRRRPVVSFLVVVLLSIPALLYNQQLAEHGGIAAVYGNIFGIRGILIWWMGVLLADIYTQRIRLRPGWLLLGVILFPIGVLTERAFSPILCGIGVVGLIAAGLEWQRRGGTLRILNSLKWLGEMSYSLYVLHFPLFVLIGGYLMQTHGGAMPLHGGWVIAGLALAMGVSFLAHLVVERPFLPSQRKVAAHSK